VTTVWPSDANFLLIDSAGPDAFLRASMAGGTLVRDMRANPALPNSFRITVGTRAQNDALISSLEAA
jgi:histidinol-phosphate aminotransferase